MKFFTAPQTSIDATELAAGLIKGLVQHENMQALALCFSDHHDFVNDFEFALAEMTSNTSDGLIKGLEMFASKVKYLHINLKECKDSLNDIEAIQTWVSMYLPKEDLSATIMSEVSTHLA